MSGASKRPHEEGSYSTPSKRPHEETSRFPNLSGKLIQSTGNDFHPPFEPGQDGRLAKVQRTEPRDLDKRSSLLHRMSSSNISLIEHPITSDNRSELRDLRDARDIKTDTRETKAENREVYSETRMDPQGSKGDTDIIRLDSKVDEKESKHDRDDYKADVKLERDGYNAANSHSNLKEPKEHHRLKRYSESPSDGLDTWRVARHGTPSGDEVVKDISTVGDRDSLEAREAVGENKVDLKGEDKFRDRDRKRKDEKHRDWGDVDEDRNDRRNSLQVGSANNERKELTREREMERWERERKEAPKDKERKDREKDLNKRDISNANEKETTHNEKELVDGSAKNPEEESTALEPKRLDDSWRTFNRDSKDRKRDVDGEGDRHERRSRHYGKEPDDGCAEGDIVTALEPKRLDDSWRTFNRDSKDRKRDVDGEGDRHERRSRHYGKELDDGCAEGDGVTDRDREAFGYGVHQRRRMLRTRGTPQTPNREPRFRPTARDNEGSQDKTEVFAVLYKPGECMQELLKLWKEFEASQDSKSEESLQNGPTLEIRIAAEYVTATNHQVKGGQLWGTDVYTNDSDLVAVLMHTGYCRRTSTPPPSAIHELRVTVRVLPPQDCYTSTLRNNIRSRSWGAGIGCSFRVERCCILKKGGGTIDLEPHLTHTAGVEPTLAPVSAERTMTTRSAASNALRQQRFVREVTIQYNLCNEPWLKYSINIVADKGLKKPLYTSARLKKGEVLYLETQFSRYELCFNGEKALCNGTTSTSSHAPELVQERLHNHNSHGQTGGRNQTDRENIIDLFRWSCCKKPLPQKVMQSYGIPLPIDHLEVLEESLDWEEVQWSQTGVWIAGKEYAIARVHFLSPS